MNHAKIKIRKMKIAIIQKNLAFLFFFKNWPHNNYSTEHYPSFAYAIQFYTQQK